MRKITAIVLMAVLILGLVPSILALPQQTQEKAKERLERIGLAAGRDTAELETKEEMPRAKAKALELPGLRQAQTFDEIRQHQTAKLGLAIEKCKEIGTKPEVCAKMFEKRMELVEKLNEKDLERIQKLEINRMGNLKEFSSLAEQPAFAKFKAEKNFKAREIGKEKAGKAAEAFAKATERLEQSKERYKAAKERLEQVREKVKGCGKEECEQLREDLKARTADSLLESIDIIDNKLLQIKQKIEESEVLSEEEAAALIAAIDAKLAETKEIGLNLKAKESFTKVEIKEVTQKLKETLQEATKTARKGAIKLMSSRIGGIIVKSKHLALKLERVMVKAAEQGIDTDAIKMDVDQFEAMITEAKEEYESALKLFSEDKIQEAQSAMQRSHQKLQKAHVFLKSIVAKLRAENLEKELEKNEELEVEAVVDAELQKAAAQSQ